MSKKQSSTRVEPFVGGFAASMLCKRSPGHSTAKMLRACVLLLCLAVAVAMPYTATLQGAQGGHRTLVIVENMVRFDLEYLL
jgi:hypothetical protein